MIGNPAIGNVRELTVCASAGRPCITLQAWLKGQCASTGFLRGAWTVHYHGGGMELAELRAKIRDIKDFPTEGILFKDITTLLKDGPAFRAVVDMLAANYAAERVDVVIGVESRGFIFGGALAHQLGAGFVPVRKLGKLPGKTIEVEYELEYGRDALAVHED